MFPVKTDSEFTMSTPAKTPAAQAPKTTPPKTVPAAKKTESLAGDSAVATAKDDTVKAIEKLEIRQKAMYVQGSIDLESGTDHHSSNTNNVARVANSHITDPEAKLTPLVSIKTGKPLEKFPDSSKDIQKLTCECKCNFLAPTSD